MVKMDSMGKRIGLLLIAGAILLLALFYGLWLVGNYQGVNVLDAWGKPISTSRSYYDALVHEWIGLTLVIFPMFAAGCILIMGYGDKIVNWVKHGPRNGGDDEKE